MYQWHPLFFSQSIISLFTFRTTQECYTGSVYEATHVKTSKAVTIKLSYSPEDSDNRDFVEDEVKLLKELNGSENEFSRPEYDGALGKFIRKLLKTEFDLKAFYEEAKQLPVAEIIDPEFK